MKTRSQMAATIAHSSKKLPAKVNKKVANNKKNLDTKSGTKPQS